MIPAKPTVTHPHPDDSGLPVVLHCPSHPTDSASWSDAQSLAVAVPNGHVPKILLGTSLRPWTDPPAGDDGWECLAEQANFQEPPWQLAGMPEAAGTVIVEPDGRIWLVAPSNRFGGHVYTFPKGKKDLHTNDSLRATALRETFEETGLQVSLVGHLCDSKRTTSLTRFYIARRTGGSPAEMGWESQAVALAPVAMLPTLLTNPSDRVVLAAIRRLGKL